MISFNYIYFVILIRVIASVHSLSSPGDILGQSACETYTTQQTFCGLPDAPIESFPTTCSSYIYTSLGVINNKITDLGIGKQTIDGYLDKLIQTNKSVLIYYDHLNVKSWCAAIQPNNTDGQTAQMNDLKMFLNKHKGIKGIILKSLIEQVDPPKPCPDLNQNLKCYLGLLKKTFPDLPIGIRISAREEIDYYQHTILPWVDFKELDPLVDFYVINFLFMNECTDEFLQTGQYPLTEGSNYTVDSVRIFIEKAGATSSKIHYRFQIFGQDKDPSANFCAAFVSSYCKRPQDVKTTMCADTIQSLYEKGAYAKQYGAGFVVNNIDNDDFDCTCQCGQSYPGFNALLSGYNGGPPPPPCALFDRT